MYYMKNFEPVHIYEVFFHPRMPAMPGILWLLKLLLAICTAERRPCACHTACCRAKEMLGVPGQGGNESPEPKSGLHAGYMGICYLSI